MEIYLKFAENKSIMAKRQGQQEESTREMIQTQKLRGCGERSPRSRAAVFGLYRLAFGSCPSEGSRLVEGLLAHIAQRAFKALRHLAPGRSRRDAALGIPPRSRRTPNRKRCKRIS